MPDDKNTESIILDGYEFRMDKIIGAQKMWRCIKTNCGTTFITYDDIVEIKKRVVHNHAPTFHGNLDECSVEIVEIRLDKSVKTSGSKTNNYVSIDEDSNDSIEKAKDVFKDIRRRVNVREKTDDKDLTVSKLTHGRREFASKERYNQLERRASLIRSNFSPFFKLDASSKAIKKNISKEMVKRRSYL